MIMVGLCLDNRIENMWLKKNQKFKNRKENESILGKSIEEDWWKRVKVKQVMKIQFEEWVYWTLKE